MPLTFCGQPFHAVSFEEMVDCKLHQKVCAMSHCCSDDHIYSTKMDDL